MPIQQCLMSRGSPAEIKVIVSIPAAIGQCGQYVRSRYPSAEIRPAGSTAQAAKLAQKFPEMAAIGCSASAEKYELNVIEEGIQDRSENFTRFVVIGRSMPKPSSRDKTSLALCPRPGALVEMLEELGRRKIKVTRIESRPSEEGRGERWCFIDLEGHSKSPPLSAAILSLRDQSVRLKVLGSYPSADAAGEALSIARSLSGCHAGWRESTQG